MDPDLAASESAEPQPDAIVYEAPADTPESMNPRQAAKLLASLRHAKAAETQPEKPAQRAATPPPAQESEAAPAAEDAAPPEEATGETQEADPAAEPPIELPRSWKKEQADVWATLDRDLQQRLVDQDREASAVIRKAQNEAAEAKKSAEAKIAQAEKATQQYENALPQLLNTLQSQQAGEFADVKTLADVDRLAREDWPRYIQWDMQQKKIAAVQQEVNQAELRKFQEQQQKFADFAKQQDKLFLEKVPEMATPEKASKLRDQALGLLKDLGFDDDQLGRAYNSQGDFSLRDHRVQMLVVDALRYREAQARAKNIVTKQKPVPPVQRPGAAPNKGIDNQARVESLQKQLAETRSVRSGAALAVQLLHAKRAAAAAT